MSLFAVQRIAHNALLEDAAALHGRSLWDDAARRFRANKAAMAGIIVLGLITLGAIFAPYLSPYTVEDLDWMNITAPPSLETGHWFGTDGTGKICLC